MKDGNSEPKPYRNYSVAFKMKVVEEVENGLITGYEARKLYGIPGKATIGEWIQKYGINERINRTVYVMTHEEELEVIRLRKEVRQLKRSLGDSQVRSLALESLIELAEEKYHLEIKKNFGTQVLEELRKKLNPADSNQGSE